MNRQGYINKTWNICYIRIVMDNNGRRDQIFSASHF